MKALKNFVKSQKISMWFTLEWISIYKVFKPLIKTLRFKLIKSGFLLLILIDF